MMPKRSTRGGGTRRAVRGERGAGARREGGHRRVDGAVREAVVSSGESGERRDDGRPMGKHWVVIASERSLG